MRINKENTIGLVVDLQENIFPKVDNKEEMLNNCLKIISGLKTLQIPIIVTQQHTEQNGGTIKEINEAIGNFSYIEKMQFSCYREPAFIRVLNRVGKRNVVIVGLQAHISILQTTLDLLYNNFNPVIVTDSIGSRTQEDKRIALWRLRDVGAVMATTESILYELCRESGTEDYKSITKLLNA
ncbi:MAG: isochorismatase family protein [Bacteroidales bacterium]|nr:isochorismatase family protein [Bacteroidales bacterium]